MTTLNFTSYANSSGSSYAGSQTCLGSDGNVWCVSIDGIFWKTTPSGATTYGSVSGSPDLIGICQGSDGDMYLTGSPGNSGYFYQVDPSTMTVVNTVSVGYTNNVGFCITGPDGNVWASFGGIGSSPSPGIVKLVPGTSTFTVYTVTVGGMGQLYSDGTYMWSCGPQYASGTFGNCYLQRITTSGTITSYSITSDHTPSSIAPDSGGDLWLGGANLYQVSKSGSLLATITLGAGASVRCGLYGYDNNPWFGDYGLQNLYQVNASAATETTYTFRATGSSPPNTGGTPKDANYGVLGSDGNMWWSDNDAQTVVQVTGLVVSAQQHMVRIL